MRRRSRAGGEPAKKAQRRKTGARKSRITPKILFPRSSSAARKETKVARLTRERDEALEQQTATSEVLRVISSAPGELEPVFQAILANATRICNAKFGNLWLCEGNNFRIAATHGAPPAYVEYLKREPVVTPEPESAMAQIASRREVVQIEDISKAPIYGMSMRVATIRLAKARSLVGVPMIREYELIGIIAVYRQEVRPFNDRQVDLLKNFAAQAVIAIENTRLLNELRQRTDDLTERTAELTELLDQQTATSEVLQVISSSPGDLQPAFETMLENAVRLCDAKFGNIYRWDGELFHLLAAYNTPHALAEFRKRSALRPTSVTRRLVEAKTTAHVVDLAADQAYTDERDPGVVSAVELGGVRTFLTVPMIKDNELIGSFSLYRPEVCPFTDKQIALVTSFASQAVIAIENARLLNELRQRTTDLSQRTIDLTEALEQQTATSEVLKVISRSPADLQPVFDTILANATRLCDASYGGMWLRNGDRLCFIAQHGGILPETYFAKLRASSISLLNSEIPAVRAIRNRRPVQVEDLREEPAYLGGDPLPVYAVEVPAAERWSSCRCSRTMSHSALSPFTDGRFAPSPTSRSS